MPHAYGCYQPTLRRNGLCPSSPVSEAFSRSRSPSSSRAVSNELSAAGSPSSSRAVSNELSAAGSAHRCAGTVRRVRFWGCTPANSSRAAHRGSHRAVGQQPGTVKRTESGRWTPSGSRAVSNDEHSAVGHAGSQMFRCQTATAEDTPPQCAGGAC